MLEMVSYRDDHDATLARLAAVEREAKLAAADNLRLEKELVEAKEWLGGARRRWILLGGMVALNALVFIAGLMAGRTTAERAEPTVLQAAPPPVLPAVYGVIVADGPDVGHWTLHATRCAVRQEGVELTATGSDGHSVWVADGKVEIELPAGALQLAANKHCWGKYEVAVAPTGGYVNLDCSFADNRIQGRIQFTNCR